MTLDVIVHTRTVASVMRMSAFRCLFTFSIYLFLSLSVSFAKPLIYWYWCHTINFPVEIWIVLLSCDSITIPQILIHIYDGDVVVVVVLGLCLRKYSPRWGEKKKKCVCIEYDKKLYFVLFETPKIIQQTHRHQSIERWAMGYECCSLINDIYFDTSLSSYAITKSNFVRMPYRKWTRINGIHNLWIGIENSSSTHKMKKKYHRKRIMYISTLSIDTHKTDINFYNHFFFFLCMFYVSSYSHSYLSSTKRQTIFSCKIICNNLYCPFGNCYTFSSLSWFDHNGFVF